MWYIGQKIVAVKNHRQGKFKEGDIFTINQLSNAVCSCNHVRIDIGITPQSEIGICYVCNARYLANGTWWFNENNFAPLDEIQAHESAVNKLLQELNLQIQ